MTKVNSTFTSHTYGTVNSHYNETRNMTTYSMRRHHFTNCIFHAVSQTSVRKTRISRLNCILGDMNFLETFCAEKTFGSLVTSHTHTHTQAQNILNKSNEIKGPKSHPWDMPKRTKIIIIK